MPTDHQNLIYNVTGQTIWLDAPEGAPSSVTSVSVFPWDVGDDATAQSATTGSPSVVSGSTTVDVASGASQTNPRLISLTATTGIVVGREYVLQNAASAVERPEVVEIVSGVSVLARMPLLHDYAAGATFKSARMSISVDSTWIADSTKISEDDDPNPGYRIRWVYVVNSQTYVRYTYCDVVRASGKHNVTAADMDAMVGNWSGLLPKHHRADSGRALLDEAYRRVELDLFAHGVADEMVRNQEAIDSLVKASARQVLYEHRLWSGTGSLEELAYFRDEYNGMLNRLFKVTSTVAIATDTSGAATRADTGGVWRR